MPFSRTHRSCAALDRATAKVFRSYTNPTAGKALFEMFGLDQVLELYGTKLKPYHTLLYNKYRNPTDLESQHTQLSAKPEDYLISASAYLKARGVAAQPDGNFALYHATDSMEAYRNIVLQGNVASTDGTAGAGGVRRRRTIARVRGPVEGPGKKKTARRQTQHRAGREGGRHHRGGRASPHSTIFGARRPRCTGASTAVPSTQKPQDEYSAFADFIGADVVRYPYNGTFAYVVKNGGAIVSQEGITVPVMDIRQVRADLRAAKDPLKRLAQLIEFDPSLLARIDFLIDNLPDEKKIAFFHKVFHSKRAEDAIIRGMADPMWARNPEAFGNFMGRLSQRYASQIAKRIEIARFALRNKAGNAAFLDFMTVALENSIPRKPEEKGFIHGLKQLVRGKPGSAGLVYSDELQTETAAFIGHHVKQSPKIRQVLLDVANHSPLKPGEAALEALAALGPQDAEVLAATKYHLMEVFVWTGPLPARDADFFALGPIAMPACAARSRNGFSIRGSRSPTCTVPTPARASGRRSNISGSGACPIPSFCFCSASGFGLAPAGAGSRARACCWQRETKRRS